MKRPTKNKPKKKSKSQKKNQKPKLSKKESIRKVQDIIEEMDGPAQPRPADDQFADLNGDNE